MKIRETEKADEWDDRPDVTVHANKKVMVMSEDNRAVFGRAIKEEHFREGYKLLTVMYDCKADD